MRKGGLPSKEGKQSSRRKESEHEKQPGVERAAGGRQSDWDVKGEHLTLGRTYVVKQRQRQLQIEEKDGITGSSLGPLSTLMTTGKMCSRCKEIKRYSKHNEKEGYREEGKGQ